MSNEKQSKEIQKLAGTTYGEPGVFVMQESEKNDIISDMKTIKDGYVIKIIKNEHTPKATEIVKSPLEFIEVNRDIFNAIGMFLKESDNRRAVGLAANQISCNNDRLNHRFFLIKQNLASESTGFDIIFNPEIVEHRGTLVRKHEGCLTWEGKLVSVDRYPFIVVNYNDMAGTRHENVAITGFEAQVWQHEVDHLNGIKENLIDVSEASKDTNTKIGRNDMCPCGSGKKYKKCCHLYDMNW